MEIEENPCQELLLSSLTEYYNSNPQNKTSLKEIIEGRHKLSLRLIDWLVTHYAKTRNIFYWTHKNVDGIFMEYPESVDNNDEYIRKVNIYLDYRAQLKSYAKINFDSFRRHNRITFILSPDLYIETTIGQLNFFRWAFQNKVIDYALLNYSSIYGDMIRNNATKKRYSKKNNTTIQDITKTMCMLRFD